MSGMGEALPEAFELAADGVIKNEHFYKGRRALTAQILPGGARSQ